jgi:hypothetical protein
MRTKNIRSLKSMQIRRTANAGSCAFIVCVAMAGYKNYRSVDEAKAGRLATANLPQIAVGGSDYGRQQQTKA